MLDSQKRIRITLEMHGNKFSWEGSFDDLDSGELIDQFKRLMVAEGYPPSILNDEGGEWVFNPAG